MSLSEQTSHSSRCYFVALARICCAVRGRMSAYQALELSTVFSILLCTCQALGSVQSEFVTHRGKVIVKVPCLQLRPSGYTCHGALVNSCWQLCIPVSNMGAQTVDCMLIEMWQGTVQRLLMLSVASSILSLLYMLGLCLHTCAPAMQ